MGTVRASGQRFDWMTEQGKNPFLRYRLGVVYPAGEEPRSAHGMIRHKRPPGSKWSKLYLPAAGVRLGPEKAGHACGERPGEDSLEQKGSWVKEVVWTAAYPIPSCARDAPVWELLLNRREGCKVYFARFEDIKRFKVEEKERFTFNIEEGGYYLPLRTVRDGRNLSEMEFNTLYIRVEPTDETACYFSFDIIWTEDAVSVFLLPRSEEEVPAFLARPAQEIKEAGRGWVTPHRHTAEQR